MNAKIITVIIIVSSIVLVPLITGTISFFIKNPTSKNASKLLKRIINTLWQIPFMLWYPIQSIIELFHGIFYRFNYWIHNSFDNENYRKNKEQKIVKKAVSTVLHSHSNLLNTYLNRRIAKVLTFLLQIISFITTYAGFTFFIGTVNPIAPLFMAITVQGGCFYLLNYTSSNKRKGTWKRISLLSILILVSTITSYIGIFDGVVRPVEKMESQYNNYSNVVESIINDLNEKEHNITIDYSLINDSLDIIKHTHNDADQVINSLNNQVNNINTDKKLQASWIDVDGIVHYYVTTEKDNEASNKITDLNAEINNLQGHFNKLSTYLQTNPDVNNILSACDRIIDDPDKRTDNNDKDIKIWNALKDALYECNILYSKLYPNDKNEAKNYYDTIKIDNAIKDSESRKLLENLFLSKFDLLISNNENNNRDENTAQLNSTQGKNFFELILDSSYESINKLNNLIVSKDTTRSQEIRNIINKTIDKNHSELYPLISGHDDLLQQLEKAYNEAHIENTQIMPFTMIFNDKNIMGEAIFSFVTASLVDGLSLLIAIALINKQKSILYFKKVGDLRANREEMLEDCLMYICLNKIKVNSQNKTMSNSEIQNFVVNEINNVMRGFMEKIHPIYLSDNLNSFGYITENDVLNFKEDERRLFYTLNNAALIHPCYNSEILKIINSDFDENKENSIEPNADRELIKKYDNIFIKGQIFYLVSKNLHVWFCENFSELLQNSLLFTLPDLDNSSPNNIISHTTGGEQHD